ncbi:hypothetical protein I6U33_05500 [Pseudomonas carnis]|uniref:hypothetical protein n=1 Tax=Pseudomonas TaxID=286 RepID=UPI0018E7F511|nr:MULTISPECIES: hypothetical protein [Pseudomonas]MBJ2225722.1 hypothetical protein [Pseudomonas sp. MF7451]MBW9236777.1 hypothetical protein [Pseudomonas carnis]
MNFDNVPAQMIALVCGWSFTVYLQYRSNRRAESLKRKDKIIDKLEALADWVESEVGKDGFSPINTETTFAGMISQIEVRIAQLNHHVGREIYDGTKLLALREIEIHVLSCANSQTPYKIREAVSDIVEGIEICCDAEYFSRKGFWAKVVAGFSGLNKFAQSFKGGVFALISLLLIMAVYQFYDKYLVRPLGTCVYGEQCHIAPGLLVPEAHGKRMLDMLKYVPTEK